MPISLTWLYATIEELENKLEEPDLSFNERADAAMSLAEYQGRLQSIEAEIDYLNGERC